MSNIITPQIDTTTSFGASAEGAIRNLQDRLQSTRHRAIRQRIGVVACVTFAALATCLAASATADWIFELNAVWRASWLVCVAIAATIVAVSGWRKWISNYTLSDTAIDAERNLSQFGQRLRTSVDYELQNPRPANALPSLLNSLRNETGQLAEQTEWQDAVDSRPFLYALFAALVVAIGWLAALAVLPEFRLAAARAILIPLDYTTVTFSPQSATIRPGESVTIHASISGRPIQTAQIRFQPAGSQGEWATVDLVALDADEDQTKKASSPIALCGELAATLGDIKTDTTFEVLAGPQPLPTGSIRVLQPLLLERSEARIVPPAYTRRPTETSETLNLNVLEGSNVEFKLVLSRPAAVAKLSRLASNKGMKPADVEAMSSEIPLELQDSFVLGRLTDLRNNASYALSAHTVDGMSLDPVHINIRVQTDQLPQVKFIEPPEELVVTPTTEVPMIVEASDDLGLLKFGVMYQVGSGPMQTLHEQTIEDSNDSIRVSPVLMLEDHSLTYQDAVTYFAFAEDNYFDEPRRTTTPLRFIDIRPFKLSFQVIDSSGGCCNGSSVTLEELIARQRQGLSQVFQSSQQPLSKATASRLSESQGEIQDATIELAAGLAARGILVPTLNEAADHMETAIEALDSLELTAAVSAEQQALAALIRARENVRKKLNQADSQCASACRKFDREQRQKLRLPEKKKADKQQQLAQTRQKIEDLAKREREWSQQAKQCCNSSGKSQSQSAGSKSSTSPEESTSSELPQSAEEKAVAPSEAQVAAKQEQLQSELAEIQQQLEKLDAAGKAAREQAQQAAESMQQGLAELKQRDGDAAAKEGERSAEELEQLSAHLAAMNARDFGQRLDQAQRLAQQLADRQETLEEQLRNRGESRSASSSSNLETQGTSKAEQDRTKSSSEGQNAGQQSGAKKSSAGSSEGSSARPQDSGVETTSNGEKSGGSLNRNDGNSTSEQDGKNVGIGDLARDQQRLVVQTALLADLLERLKRDATAEISAVKQMLEQADAKYSPRDIADGMRQTAEDLRAEKKAAASRGAALARESLIGLSKSLGSARGEYAQPQLKELMALEEQLAQLQQQMKRAKTDGEDSKAMAEQKWQKLESRLDKLAAADQQLADALQKLRDGPSAKPGEANSKSDQRDPSGSTLGGKAPLKPGTKLKPAQFQELDGQPTPEGFYSWLELGDFSGVRDVSKALQARIQEAILAAALIDADQPVPPAYKELVEKYYRALSDDLR